MSEHIAVDELADAAAGLLGPERARRIDAHVAGCATCTDRAAALAHVAATLAAAPQPPVPAEVVTRLDAVLAAESTRRQARSATLGRVDRSTKPSLGVFEGGRQGSERGRLRLATTVLVAALAAGVVGFAGFAVSASTGMNEPSAASPVRVSSRQLEQEATQLADSRNLSSHLFSEAWWCANHVTEGLVTGVVPAVVDGSSALLVYTSHDGEHYVTVVTGCPRPSPSAGPSVELPR